MIHEPDCPALADDEWMDEASVCICVARESTETEQVWANFRLLHIELYPDWATWEHWPFARRQRGVS
jgi:hypothetical protein